MGGKSKKKKRAAEAAARTAAAAQEAERLRIQTEAETLQRNMGEELAAKRKARRRVGGALLGIQGQAIGSQGAMIGNQDTETLG